MPPRLRAALAPLWACAAVSAPLWAWAAVPETSSAPAVAPGHYPAQMCAAVAAQAARCGPVQLHVQSAGQWALRVDDIVYRLQLRGPVLDAFVFHGTMQIDEFTATARFVGEALEFFDEGKNTRFTVRLMRNAEPAAGAASEAASSPGS